MATSWRVAKGKGGERCGAAWCLIPEGQPVQEVRLYGVTGVRKRCMNHALGEPMIRQEIDDAIHATTERQAIAETTEPATATPTQRVPSRQSRELKSFASMTDLASTFDPRQAQTGERD